jgi:hypothetical protein
MTHCTAMLTAQANVLTVVVQHTRVRASKWEVPASGHRIDDSSCRDSAAWPPYICNLPDSYVVLRSGVCGCFDNRAP